MPDLARLRAAYEKARDELFAERTPDGHWVGELSSSALATATAVSALAVVRRGIVESRKSTVEGPRDQATFDVRRSTFDDLIDRGVAWLVAHQNDDGGFGDTDLSHSNIATTYLVVAALQLAGVADVHAAVVQRANVYIDAKGRLQGLRERYGIDKTFVVPIMTNLALAGLASWREIDPLPFELACVPQSFYRFVGMPVVSYAIPALVAIGQARYFHAPPRNPITWLIRWLSLTRSLEVLRRMQPDSGGYLEATPLTSFVVMSLASIHRSPHAPREETISRSEMPAVIREGVKFLVNSIRPDGSWPIDTNLATWNTTLAINALAGAGEDVAAVLEAERRGASEAGVPTQSVGTRRGGNVLDWLLSCQHTKRHPFTGADPGGFGWSDLSGAVPDADDTAGALIALCSWRQSLNDSDSRCAAIEKAVTLASNWLLELRNRDGGWPTFCRGWGKLPFDRSGADLTAHAVRVGPYLEEEVDYGEAIEWIRYLKSHQDPDGSWSPLWFGNQDHPNEENPVYGTAKVLMAYRDLGLMDSSEARRGVAWLVANQNEDGGWGSGVWQMRNAEFGMRNGGTAERGGGAGVESKEEEPDAVQSSQYPVLSTQYEAPISDKLPSTPHSALRTPHLQSSIEETALAVEALLAACSTPDCGAEQCSVLPAPDPAAAAIEKGLKWLIHRVERGQHRQPAPIGFYFAKLWYYERLYPLTFTVAALGRACRQFARPEKPTEPSESRAP